MSGLKDRKDKLVERILTEKHARYSELWRMYAPAGPPSDIDRNLHELALVEALVEVLDSED